MIKVIVRLQSCTTRPGRRAFVAHGREAHGIARGPVRHYVVEAPSWPAVRSAVGSVDSTGKRTMGFSQVNSETVESFTIFEARADRRTGSVVRPLLRKAGE